MDSSLRPEIAWLGTGIMGAPMAKRLAQSGFRVRAWNRTPGKTRELVADGVQPASSAYDAAKDADIVAICVTDAAAVEACVFDRLGAASAMKPGSLIIDFSTIGVDATVRLARRLESKFGLEWLDAPVSGGPNAARDGKLAIFCGGRPQDLALAEPMLAKLSQNCTLMGAVGAGQATKMCNQLIVASGIVALAEAVALANALGVDPARLPAALAGGYADSSALRTFAPRMASQELEPKISEVATMLKDVRSINAAAADLPVSLDLIRAVQTILERAAAQGLAEADLGILSSFASRN